MYIHTCRYLNKNHISKLPEKIFTVIPLSAHLQVVDLTGNPLECLPRMNLAGVLRVDQHERGEDEAYVLEACLDPVSW